MKKIIKKYIYSFLITFCVLFLIVTGINFGNIKQAYTSFIGRIEYNLTNRGSSFIKLGNYPLLGDKKTGSLFDPCVLMEAEDSYIMFVSHRKTGAIAMTTSEDGISWQEIKDVLLPGDSESWEKIVNRCSVIKHNNTYYMWYTGQNNNQSHISLAISSDLNSWVKYPNCMISPEFDFEGESVMNPSVIYDQEENLFKMWYACGETYEPDYICYAESRDGINWIKNAQPVFNPSNSFVDSYKVGGPEVKLIEGEYYLFYIGYSDVDTGRICAAKSKDGKTDWIRSTLNPLIESSPESFDSESCYKPAALWNIYSQEWQIWYNGRTNNSEYIGYAFYDEFDLKF